MATLDQVQVPSGVIDQMCVQRQRVIRPSSVQEAQAVVRVYQRVCVAQWGEGRVRRVCNGRKAQSDSRDAMAPRNIGDVSAKAPSNENESAKARDIKTAMAVTSDPATAGCSQAARVAATPDGEFERVMWHMQAKLAGCALNQIEIAQSFLGRWVYSEVGTLPAKFKRLIARVNEKIMPWVKVLVMTVDAQPMKRLSEWWARQGCPWEYRARGVNVVYARFNIHTDVFYVGETEDWQQRQQQHAYETFRHSAGCTNRCRGCKEHRKYTRHAPIPMHEWITVPLMRCKDRPDAKAVERMLIDRWSPKLNGREIPRFMLKDSYAKDLKRRKAGSRKPPWRRGTHEEAVQRDAMVTQ